MRDEFEESQFKADSDSNVVRCPYCKYEYQPEAEDYSEDRREQECSDCGKKYWLHQTFSVDHCVKPDCGLNGEQHKWCEVRGHRDYEECSVCDQWRKIPAKLADSAGDGK